MIYLSGLFTFLNKRFKIIKKRHRSQLDKTGTL